MTIIVLNEDLGPSKMAAAMVGLLSEAAVSEVEVTPEALGEAAGIAAFHLACGGTAAEAAEFAEVSLEESMAERLGAMAAAAKLAAEKAKSAGGEVAKQAAERARAAATAAANAAERAKGKAKKGYADAKEGYFARMVKARAAK